MKLESKADKYVALAKETDEAVLLKAVREDFLALKYVENQTPEICLEAISQNHFAIQCIKKKTEALKEKALQLSQSANISLCAS